MEDAKAALEQANLRVLQTKEAAAQRGHHVALASAHAILRRLIQQLTKHRAALQKIHDDYGATIQDYARSMASGADVRTRQVLQQEVYGKADGLRQRLAVAFKDAGYALRLLGSATDTGRESLAFKVETAQAAAATALAQDPAAIRSAIEALVKRREELRPGAQSMIHITLNEPAWYPGASDVTDSPGAQPETGPWRR